MEYKQTHCFFAFKSETDPQSLKLMIEKLDHELQIKSSALMLIKAASWDKTPQFVVSNFINIPTANHFAVFMYKRLAQLDGFPSPVGTGWTIRQAVTQLFELTCLYGIEVKYINFK